MLHTYPRTCRGRGAGYAVPTLVLRIINTLALFCFFGRTTQQESDLYRKSLRECGGEPVWQSGRSLPSVIDIWPIIYPTGKAMMQSDSVAASRCVKWKALYDQSALRCLARLFQSYL